MDDEQKKIEDASRARAAEAYRYVRPKAAIAPAFETLDLSDDEVASANKKRDDRTEQIKERFSL